MKKVAVICAQALGDGIVTMVLAENLRRQAFQVTVYSTLLCSCAEWFPDHDIRRFDDKSTPWHEYDIIWASDGAPAILLEAVQSKRIPFNRYFPNNKNIITSTLDYCRYQLLLTDIYNDNGLRVPALKKILFQQPYIVLGPSSSNPHKNWPLTRYIQLARQLKKHGQSVVFSFSDSEKKTWHAQLPPDIPTRYLSTVSDFCYLLAGAQCFIGNDSGGGHLASALQIPVVSLVHKPKKFIEWRPAWGHVTVIGPTWQCWPMGWLRWRFWGYTLSVKTVLKAVLNITRYPC